MNLTKHKSLLTWMGGGAIICIVLLIISSGIDTKEDKTRKQDISGTEASKEPSGKNMQDIWEEMDRRSNPIADVNIDTSIMPGNPTVEESIINSLSIYPSPSYVSEQQDTLIYKNGIYKRIGFVKEEPSYNDTIIVDGQTYVKAR